MTTDREAMVKRLTQWEEGIQYADKIGVPLDSQALLKLVVDCKAALSAQQPEPPQNPCTCVPDGDDGTVAHLCKWHRDHLVSTIVVTPTPDEALIEEIVEKTARIIAGHKNDLVTKAAVRAALYNLHCRTAQGGEQSAEMLAQRFHEAYERLAPQFGYVTRKETREFDKETSNGRLMIAVCDEIIRGHDRQALKKSADTVNVPREHPDDIAVRKFADAMRDKMARKRAQGRGGWDNPSECSIERLEQMFAEHVSKGDMVDIANFAMMLWHRKAAAKEWKK